MRAVVVNQNASVGNRGRLQRPAVRGLTRPTIQNSSTAANLQEFKGYISSMAQQLMGVQW